MFNMFQSSLDLMYVELREYFDECCCLLTTEKFRNKKSRLRLMVKS